MLLLIMCMCGFFSVFWFSLMSGMDVENSFVIVGLRLMSVICLRLWCLSSLCIVRLLLLLSMSMCFVYGSVLIVGWISVL